MDQQPHPHALFGFRLRAARLQARIPQDRLGVMIGLDEGTSSARMSRYETGVHQPPFQIAERIAAVLNVPVAYFYCSNDQIAQFLVELNQLSSDAIDDAVNECLEVVRKRAADARSG